MITRSAAAVTIENPLAGGGVNNFPQLLEKIFLAVAGLVAAISTIMITVAGIMYLTSAGSTERMAKAKTAFVYAIIGFIVAISASTIVAIIKSVIGAEAES